ncbi:TetR-like C-terminal domain-containing protein [Bacillus seohaeanensis]
MKESVDERYLEPKGDIQLNYLISYQANAIIGILMEWHRQGYKTSIAELNKQLITILSVNSTFRKV